MTMTKASAHFVFRFSATLRMILRLIDEQVVARHARLARHAGGDDDHVGAGAVVPVGGAGDLGVVAEHRAVLLQVQRLALGQALLLRDVEQHDVAELVGARPATASSPPMFPAPMRAILFLRGMSVAPYCG